MIPSPQIGLQTEGCPEQVHPVSTVQLPVQPSPGFVFPSSQASEPSMDPLPHRGEHTEGWPEQDQPDST